MRATGFEKAAREGGPGTIEAISTAGDANGSSFVGAEISKSERPELTSAKIIVLGGRALQNSENFHSIIEPLTDKLGASRAAVDAGYVPNDYKLGQTGKIVAP